MKCQQTRIYLSPYLDSELDPTTTYEVSRHLETCSACADLFAAEEELERAIRARLRRARGDEEDEEEVIERALSRAFALRTRLSGWRAVFAAASLLLVLGLFAYRLTSIMGDPVPELVAMAAEDHRRYLVGDVSPELLTKDPADLTSFLDAKLAGDTGSFPTGDGWEVEGARLCSFHDIPVGFVTLRYHGIPVSVVDLPEENAAQALDLGLLAPDDRCFELSGGRGILRRTSSGFRVAFGDVEMAKLEEVVLAAR